MGQLGAQLTNPPNVANGPAVQAAGPSTPGPNPPTMLGQQDNAPTESKGHKLLQILGAGLQGALAGRAAQENMIAQTGGRRAGGVGTGFQAGFQLPFQRAMMQNQLQQQQAQTGLAQAGLQPVQTPYGQMPAELASKSVLPWMIRSEGGLEKQQLANQGGVAKQELANQGQVAKEQIARRFMAVPGVGLFDTQTRQLQPGTQQGVSVTPELAQEYGLPKDFIGKPMSIANLAQLERVQNQGITTVQGQSGPALVNKQKGTVQNLGLGNPGMGKPMEVGNPDQPGQTQITTGAQAVAGNLPGKGSASVAVPKQAAAAEVPTKIGDQKVAFNTAIAHADLLRQAARALNNGNVQVLNNLSNRAMSEFGDPALTDFNAIANAYNHEVTNVISKGHITDAEVAKGGGTMPSGANYATIDKVLNSYQSLMNSKMSQLNKQKQSAINQAQPNKNAPANSAGITIKRDSNGRIIGIQ